MRDKGKGQRNPDLDAHANTLLQRRVRPPTVHDVLGLEESMARTVLEFWPFSAGWTTDVAEASREDAEGCGWTDRPEREPSKVVAAQDVCTSSEQELRLTARNCAANAGGSERSL